MTKNYSNFKWEKEDYLELQKATRAFNKKLRVLKKYDLVDYVLPEEKTYQDIKREIFTKEQLKQTLTSLNEFQKGAALDKIRLKNDQVISKWQIDEIQKRQPIAISYINKRIEEESLKTNFKGTSNDDLDQLIATKEALKNYDTKTGVELRYAINRIMRLGNVDYETYRYSNFRTNFMEVFNENLSSYDNYREFKRVLESIKDPKEFYEFVKKSPFLDDIFNIYYEPEVSKHLEGKTSGEGRFTFGGGSFESNEAAFNYSLEHDYNMNLSNKKLYSEDIDIMEDISDINGYIYLYSNDELVGKFSSGIEASRYVKKSNLKNIKYRLGK